MQNKRNKGFTLLEILLVIAAIGILAAIVLIAINPNKQLAQARDTARQSDINTLQKALDQYLIETGAYPASVSNTPGYICNTGSLQSGGPSCAGFLDLKVLVPNYIAAIPRDTQATGDSTGYIVSINPSNNKIAVTAGLAERKGIVINPFSISNGLVLHLDAGNPASYPGSGTTWTDLSGNNNNGALVNGVGYDNANGGSLVFDGVDDHINIQNSSSLVFTNNFTVQIVCSSDYPDSSYRSPIMHTTNWDWMDGYGFYQNNGNFSFFVNAYDGAHIVTVSKTAFPMTHWVATYDGQNLKIYENGVLRATGSPYSADIINPSSNLRVGSSTGETGAVSRYWWNGNIAQSSIYNRALTPQEIQQNYNATRARFGL